MARQYPKHDMDASPLCPRWELPGYGRADVACDPALSVPLLQTAQDFSWSPPRKTSRTLRLQRKAHHGLVVSGDRFIATAQASNTAA